MEKILNPKVLNSIRHVQVVFVTLWKWRINRSINERLRSATKPQIKKYESKNNNRVNSAYVLLSTNLLTESLINLRAHCLSWHWIPLSYVSSSLSFTFIFDWYNLKKWISLKHINKWKYQQCEKRKDMR